MLKKGSFRRIIVASIALIIVLVTLYIFPKHEVKIPSKTTYKKAKTSAIYLIDRNNFVSKTYININNKDKENIAKELIEALISGSNKNKYLPLGFTSYISKNAILNSLKIDEDLIILDFNEYLFSGKEGHEEKIIESIVYTMTEIDGISKVKILINGEPLTRIPSINKTIPDILTRDIGINHKFIVNTFKNTMDVTAYFINSYNDITYYIPVTFTVNSENEKIEVIINELLGKDYIDDNLSTYITAGTELKNYEILENEINLEFNNLIFNGFNEIDEEVMYGITYSVKDTYNVDTVRINNKTIN